MPRRWVMVLAPHLAVVLVLLGGSFWLGPSTIWSRGCGGTTFPDPVPTCNFGAWVHRRKSLTKIEYTVYTGSFDLPIQTTFPVSFGSHSLGPTTYGYCKFFILNRAISCSLLGFSPESISGHTISGANWFSRAALQVEAASSSKYHQLRNYRGVNF